MGDRQPPSLIAALAACCVLAGCGTAGEAPRTYAASRDALPEPLTTVPGDATRGREIVVGRDGACLLCHVIPASDERFMGNVGPPLAGIGARFTAAQLRLRVADPRRVNPEAVMPSYYEAYGLSQVALPYRGKTLLTAQQIEDVVAYLATLR